MSEKSRWGRKDSMSAITKLCPMRVSIIQSRYFQEWKEKKSMERLVYSDAVPNSWEAGHNPRVDGIDIGFSPSSPK
jgi:hypothetical protein